MGLEFPRQWPDTVRYVRTADDIQEAMKVCMKETAANYRMPNGDPAKCQLILVVMRAKNSQFYCKPTFFKLCLPIPKQFNLIQCSWGLCPETARM